MAKSDKKSKKAIEGKKSKKTTEEKVSKKKSKGTIGYCVRCKEKRTMLKPKESLTARGMRMAKGKCEVCSTNMSVMLGKAA